MKKLYRSNTNKTVAGVLGGLSEYLEVDPTVIRVLFLLLAVFTWFGPAIIFYVGACLLIPIKPAGPAV